MNNAFKSDPNAIFTLLHNRIPCNERLADDEFVQVFQHKVLNENSFQVDALSVINAILMSENLPTIVLDWSNNSDENGSHKLLGFKLDQKVRWISDDESL